MDGKWRRVIRDEEGYYISIKVLTHQEDMTKTYAWGGFWEDGKIWNTGKISLHLGNSYTGRICQM